MTLKRLDHIGILVKDLEKALTFYRDQLGLRFIGIRENLEYKVRMAGLALGEMTIDLVEPGTGSPLEAQLAEKGEGLHHICFEVSDLKEMLRELDQLGVSLLFKDPQSGEDRTWVGYVSPSSANNVPIELKEKIS